MVIENKFDTNEVALIRKAINEWVVASDSDESLIFTEEGFNNPGEFTVYDWRKERDFGVIFKGFSTDIGYKQIVAERGGKHFRGLAGGGNDNILMVSDRIDSEELFYKIILHEIGHIHGLSHMEGGIMEPQVKRDGCIHEVDIKQFCEINDCGPNARSTCED